MYTTEIHAVRNSIVEGQVGNPRRYMSGVIINSKPDHVGDITSRFGSRLRELRRQRNLTQMQMAQRFGIDRSYISEVERGRKSVSLVILELIAMGFHMSLSDVMQDI